MKGSKLAAPTAKPSVPVRAASASSTRAAVRPAVTARAPAPVATEAWTDNLSDLDIGDESDEGESEWDRLRAATAQRTTAQAAAVDDVPSFIHNIRVESALNSAQMARELAHVMPVAGARPESAPLARPGPPATVTSLVIGVPATDHLGADGSQPAPVLSLATWNTIANYARRAGPLGGQPRPPPVARRPSPPRDTASFLSDVWARIDATPLVPSTTAARDVVVSSAAPPGPVGARAAEASRGDDWDAAAEPWLSSRGVEAAPASRPGTDASTGARPGHGQGSRSAAAGHLAHPPRSIGGGAGTMAASIGDLGLDPLTRDLVRQLLATPAAATATTTATTGATASSLPARPGPAQAPSVLSLRESAVGRLLGSDVSASTVAASLAALRASKDMTQSSATQGKH